jgi:general secretion pathway protein H
MIEILLGHALIGLAGTLLIGGSAQLFSDKPTSPDDVFWKAAATARKTALLSGHDVQLGFADDRDHGRRFTISGASGSTALPVTTSGELAVNFLSAQRTAGSAIILAGQVVETQALPHVTFYSDGTCTAFRVQIRRGVDAHILSIDPWTCAPLLAPVDPNAR